VPDVVPGKSIGTQRGFDGFSNRGALNKPSEGVSHDEKSIFGGRDRYGIARCFW
jgi:hypothetical protein